MTNIYLYIAIAFIVGFAIAWVIQIFAIYKLKKINKSALGFLESEKLKKETLQKENTLVHHAKQTIQQEFQKRLKESLDQNKIMDADILLLQKSNEETEALLQAGEPALHALKLKLIEAQNTIARFKAKALEEEELSHKYSK